SATMPPPIAHLAREILKDPVLINVDRPATPAAGVFHAAYAVPAELKSRLLVELLNAPGVRSVLAFTRTKHRADRLPGVLVSNPARAGPRRGDPARRRGAA